MTPVKGFEKKLQTVRGAGASCLVSFQAVGDILKKEAFLRVSGLVWGELKIESGGKIPERG